MARRKLRLIVDEHLGSKRKGQAIDSGSLTVQECLWTPRRPRASQTLVREPVRQLTKAL